MKNKKRRRAFVVNCIETLLGLVGIFAGIIVICFLASVLLQACGVS